MSTITTLAIQKHNKSRVSVFLDETYAFSVSLNVALGLKKGQILSPADIETLQQVDEKHQAYEQAMRYLGYRSRSQYEVEQYLAQKEYSPSTIELVIARLLEANYLDDAEFARLWVTDRENLRPRGRRALQHELRQKGVADKVIEAALTELDETDSAWAALEPKLRQWKNLPQENFKKKLFSFLSRRGFGYEVCRQSYERAWAMMNPE